MFMWLFPTAFNAFRLLAFGEVIGVLCRSHRVFTCLFFVVSYAFLCLSAALSAGHPDATFLEALAALHP